MIVSTLLILVTARFMSYVYGDCIEMKEVKKHMPQWVDVVPYSHLTNSTYGYPTDCSGFVSWVLQGEELKAYEYASNKYSTEISNDELRYGDIVTHVFGDHCEKKNEVLDFEKVEVEMSWPSFGPEISGHVFFFDKWVDGDCNEFWAYESSETQDQTSACLAENNPITRPMCLNHHVKKERKILDKYRQDQCTSKEYGVIKGGPKRLSKKLLCHD